MGVLSGHEPKRQFEIFEEMSAIPRKSGDTKGIADYCEKFAKDRGLRCRRDAADNVVIFVDGTPGYENSAPVLLQAHTDMVCVKEPGYEHDFAKDGIKLKVDGDWISAESTTLGADNGIGAALIMAIAEDKTIEHPPLEILLTSDEEIGLIGAQKLDMSDLKGKVLMNFDCGSEGVATVSCAGGRKTNAIFPAKKTAASGTVLEITVDGLLGGHSGGEIDKERANSNHVMGRILYKVMKVSDVRIVSINGGSAENAIAATTVAQIAVDKADEAMAVIEKMGAALKKEYATSDPGLFVKCENKGAAKEAVSSTESANVIKAIMLSPNGVQAMSMDIPSLVTTSMNLGVIRTDADTITLVHCLRSSVVSRKEEVQEIIDTIVETFGGRVEVDYEFSAWEFKKESPFRDMLSEVAKEVLGKELTIQATHGGLECGVFYGMRPDIEYVSMGSNSHDAHRPGERTSISSAQRMWKYTCEVLKRMK